MKTKSNSGHEVRYTAPETEVLSLEGEQIIANSGNFNTDPWQNGNSEWCR